jgi:hypothetical protein
VASNKLTLQGGVGALASNAAAATAPASAVKTAAAPSAVAAGIAEPVAAEHTAPGRELSSKANAENAVENKRAPAPSPRQFEEDELTRMAPAPSALAGAFSAAFSAGGDAAPAADAPALSMPGDEWFVGINGVPVGPIRLSELRSKAAAGAVTKESLVWRDGFEDWRPLKTYPELVAIVEEGVSSARASLTPFTPGPTPVRDPLAPASAAEPAAAAVPSAAVPSAETSTAVVTDEIPGLIPPRRTSTSIFVWLAIVIAILFGLTIGFVLFGNVKPSVKEVVKIVEVPAKGENKPDGPAAANNTVEEAAVEADPKQPKKPSSVAKTGAASESEPKTGLSGLKGLSGLSNVGPSGGPATGGPSGASGGGNQLDSGQIQSTVARYTGSVRRRCWQPALDARAKDAPTTAKVTVTITVSGSGAVENATTSGEPKGYTGLAQCIASSVRSWQFPASGGRTVANIPFVFAGQ